MSGQTSRKAQPSPLTSLLAELSTVSELTAAARSCTACDLYKTATQTVFGEGPANAEVMLIGEIPGDEEDQQGHPFVGPAGKLLHKLLEEVGFESTDLYLTNVVKHFKWEPQGTLRLHKTPSVKEVAACRPWLQAELALVNPRIIACLGSVACQSFLGRDFRVTRSHGQILRLGERFLIPMLHPAAILRMPTPEDRQRARIELTADLLRVRELQLKLRAQVKDDDDSVQSEERLPF